MGWFLQWGNWAVAKLIELLFNTTYLSDVGCTFRVLSRELVRDISPQFTVDGSSFGLEMLLLAISGGTRWSRSRSTTTRGSANPRSPATWARPSGSGCR